MQKHQNLCNVNRIKKVINDNTYIDCNGEKEFWIICIFSLCGERFVEDFLNRFDVDINNIYVRVGSEKVSVGWYAYSKGYDDFVKFLLQHQYNPTLDDGFTLLHWLASVNDIEKLKLIKNVETDFSKKDYEGEIPDRTPLHWAAQENSIDAVKFLLGKNVDLNARDTSGKTAYDIAMDEGNEELAKYLEIPNG